MSTSGSALIVVCRSRAVELFVSGDAGLGSEDGHSHWRGGATSAT